MMARQRRITSHWLSRLPRDMYASSTAQVLFRNQVFDFLQTGWIGQRPFLENQRFL
jgi:hypothetical protein